MIRNTKRFVGEVVELSRDCELGQEGDRAVVTSLSGHYMTLTFPDRAPDARAVHTGSDYQYLRAYEGVVEWSAADLYPALDKAKAQAVVAKARQIATLMDEICELASNEEVNSLLATAYPFHGSLDEVSCEVVGWRDAMAEKAEVSL